MEPKSKTTKSRQKPVCSKCKNAVQQKNSAQCTVCKLTYHLDCVGYPERVYNMLEPTKKANWKCPPCIRKMNSPCISTNTMSPQINVTLRRNNTKINAANKQDSNVPESPINEPVNIVISPPKLQLQQKLNMNTSPKSDSYLLSEPESFDDSSLTRDRLSKSLDYTANEVILTLDMKEQISQLTSELALTQNELENQIIENNSLRRENDNLKKETSLLKTLCNSAKIPSATSSVKKKRHSIHTDCHTAVPKYLPFSLKSSISPKQERLTEISKLQTLISTLQHDLSVTKVQIIELNAQIDTLTAKLHDYSKIDGKKIMTKTTSKGKFMCARKLCVISSTSRYKTRQLIENTIEHTEICNYITTGASTAQLLKGIDTKLSKFNQNDYCIIFISETDFEKTKSYSNMVSFIRESLLRVQHTNIIICSPIFKYSDNANLYNKRIESFNELLYVENCNYEFAYILDCNKNLTYSPEDYTRRGYLNKYRFRTIITDLQTLIHEITFEDSYTEQCSNEICVGEQTEGPISGAEDGANKNCFFRQ